MTKIAIARRAGRPDDTVELASELLAFAGSSESERAADESELAAAYVGVGRKDDALPLATRAYGALKNWGHIDEAAALTTLALIRITAGDASAAADFEETRRIIEEHPLLCPLNKAFYFDDLAIRLEQAGRAEASIFRNASAALRLSSG